MKEKLISIILPVYNGAVYMSDSIESVLNQTYQNWELIIVNDCSTDDTLEVAEAYQKKDPRIHVISNEKNLKLPCTLNRGFAKAKGEYYTWTSDDNIYKPEALTRLAKELDNDSTCSLVYSDYTDIDADGNEIGRRVLDEPEYIVIGNVVGACFLYRAEMAKKIGEYDTDLFLAEDYDYWIRICREGKIKHIKDNLYLYRRHKNSLSEEKKEFVNKQTYKAIEKNFDILYENARKNGMEFFLFDQILKRASSDLRDITKRKIYSIDRKYRFYLLVKVIKEKVYNILFKKI